MTLIRLYIHLVIATTLFGCSKNSEENSQYHNSLVDLHNDLKITYEELVDDFGWVITTDTSEKSRRRFLRTYKTKFRGLKREVNDLILADEDIEPKFRKSILDLTNFIIVYSDSLSKAADQLVHGMQPTFNFERFDTEVVRMFEVIEKSRDEFLKATELNNN